MVLKNVFTGQQWRNRHREQTYGHGGGEERVRCMERVTWKLTLPYDPAFPLTGRYPEKTIIEKDTCTPMFTAALFIIGRT